MNVVLFSFPQKEDVTILFARCDLHKQTIALCVVNQSREVQFRRRLECRDEAALRRFFSQLGEFEAVVEATASYEWFVRLVEPYARRVVLAHPKKLRIIAESARKSDNLEAQILAEFLALDMIPASSRMECQKTCSFRPPRDRSMRFKLS